MRPEPLTKNFFDHGGTLVCRRCGAEVKKSANYSDLHVSWHQRLDEAVGQAVDGR